MGKTPKRMCIVCRSIFDKGELNRFVLVDNKFVLDPKQTMWGRGFYICNKVHCLQLADKKLRALKSRKKCKR